MHSQADIHTLARVNAEALVDALGLGGLRVGREPLVRLAVRQTLPFAHALAGFDDRVGRYGLGEGARWLLPRFTRGLEVLGADRVPSTGPLLFISNHPGLSDTLALFAGIPRDDLRVLAADRPFLRALPRTSERLLYLAERPEQRLGALRGIATQFRGNGSILTFPAGAIEADPLHYPERAARLERWTDNLSALARIARDVPIVPVIVSGVLSQSAQRHWLTRVRRQQGDREWLGAMLQMIWRPFQDVTVRVQFGEPIRATTMADAPSLILNAARGLIAERAQPARRGVRV